MRAAAKPCAVPDRAEAVAPSGQSKVGKIRWQREWRLDIANGSADLLDSSVRQSRSYAARRQFQIPDTARVDPHDAATGRVHRHRIAAGDENAGVLGRTLNRAVAFHADNPIDQRELARESG